jgi:hypothetical protein
MSIFKDEVFKDKNEKIRLEAYREIGFTKEAFKDEDPDIRLEAYRSLNIEHKLIKKVKKQLKDNNLI